MVEQGVLINIGNCAVWIMMVTSASLDLVGKPLSITITLNCRKMNGEVYPSGPNQHIFIEKNKYIDKVFSTIKIYHSILCSF